ncbi:hypothetical protein J2S74_000477 [Evansella vedderi]|uniref:DUF4363 family protein n=1 Tax=Evansella vedderi TaxID=38282 RepID=A0ABT9ZSF4_9BACI|nr:DUF4363 family protein [Evansella vedderi]MDQ0253105.1 hypothetical protein [Evansella vedderi]
MMERVINSKTAKVLLTIFIIAGISWWHSAAETADNPLSRQADRVMESIDKENWDEAKREVVQLREEFERKRWFMELFGPTEHVTVTRYNLISLVEAVHGENKTESKQLLAKVKGRLNEFVVF